MTRTSDQRAMLRAYLDISQMILEDDGYRQRLVDQPKAELVAAGWPLPARESISPPSATSGRWDTAWSTG